MHSGILIFWYVNAKTPLLLMCNITGCVCCRRIIWDIALGEFVLWICSRKRNGLYLMLDIFPVVLFNLAV